MYTDVVIVRLPCTKVQKKNNNSYNRIYHRKNCSVTKMILFSLLLNLFQMKQRM